MLFKDDFGGQAGQSPSSLRWRYDVGGGGFGNGEVETYTRRPKNVSVDGEGHLDITARRERWGGTDGITRPYTSARINTHKRFTFQYGTVQARIKIPRGMGLWPAFWAIGNNISSAGWPLCGEFDIMENIGRQPTVMHGTVHGGNSAGGSWLAGRGLIRRVAFSRAFHVYGMVWGPSAIAMTLDGRAYMTVSRSDVAPGDLWNFDHAFYLILDLAVGGGGWPGTPDRTTPFPATMAVDYVHVRG
jgi:beta-glucanase (GH16 family)